MASLHLAFEVVEKIAPVEDLREAVDGGEPIDLFLIGILDVVAAQEFEDAVANLDKVTVLQNLLVNQFVVDTGTVGRAKVAYSDRLTGIDDFAVIA